MFDILFHEFDVSNRPSMRLIDRTWPARTALAMAVALAMHLQATAGAMPDAQTGEPDPASATVGGDDRGSWPITGHPFAEASTDPEPDAPTVPGAAADAAALAGMTDRLPDDVLPMERDPLAPDRARRHADAAAAQPSWAERLRPYVRETLRTVAPLAGGGPTWGGRQEGFVPWAMSVGSGLVDQPLRDVALLFVIETVLEPHATADGSATFSIFGFGRFAIETSADRSIFRLVETSTRTHWDLRPQNRDRPPPHPLARSSDAAPQRSIPDMMRYMIGRTLASPWFYVSLLASGFFALAVKRWSRRVRTAAGLAGAAGYRRPAPR